jgi:HSP20 family protein
MSRDDRNGVFRRFSRDMDRLFGEAGFRPLFLREAQEAFDWSPDVEYFERKGQFVVRADLPGLTKDDVKLNVENGVLSIQGERKQEAETKGDGWYRTERNYGAFYRSLPLPDGVKADQINATFKNGVLEIVMPLPVVEKKAKAIDIKPA